MLFRSCWPYQRWGYPWYGYGNRWNNYWGYLGYYGYYGYNQRYNVTQAREGKSCCGCDNGLCVDLCGGGEDCADQCAVEGGFAC